MNSKPRRAQGGLGLLSHTISVQRSQESIPQIPREERKEKERRAPGEGGVLFWAQEKKEREGEGVRGFLTPTTLNPKD